MYINAPNTCSYPRSLKQASVSVPLDSLEIEEQMVVRRNLDAGK